jgi:hypothetical protein
VPFLNGGHQEHGRRGGTENVASIVALGRACELAGDMMESEDTRVRALRDRLETGLLESIPRSMLNGHPTLRLPNTYLHRLYSPGNQSRKKPVVIYTRWGSRQTATSRIKTDKRLCQPVSCSRISHGNIK